MRSVDSSRMASVGAVGRGHMTYLGHWATILRRTTGCASAACIMASRRCMPAIGARRGDYMLGGVGYCRRRHRTYHDATTNNAVAGFQRRFVSLFVRLSPSGFHGRDSLYPAAPLRQSCLWPRSFPPPPLCEFPFSSGLTSAFVRESVCPAAVAGDGNPGLQPK